MLRQVACYHELMATLTCFSSNNFDTAKCMKQTQALMKCQAASEVSTRVPLSVPV